MQTLYVETLIPDNSNVDIAYYFVLEDEYELTIESGYLYKSEFLSDENITSYDDAFKALQRRFPNYRLLLK